MAKSDEVMCRGWSLGGCECLRCAAWAESPPDPVCGDCGEVDHDRVADDDADMMVCLRCAAHRGLTWTVRA